MLSRSYIIVIAILISFNNHVKSDSSNSLCKLLEPEACKYIPNGCSVTKCTETLRDTTICVNGKVDSAPICYCTTIKVLGQTKSYTDCCGKPVEDVLSLKDKTCKNAKQSDLACPLLTINACSNFQSLRECSVKSCTETSKEMAICISGVVVLPVCFCNIIIKANSSGYLTDCCNKQITSVSQALDLPCKEDEQNQSGDSSNSLCKPFESEACKYIPNGCSVTKCTETLRDTTICVNGKVDSAAICYCTTIKVLGQTKSYTDCCGKPVEDVLSLKDKTCEIPNQSDLTCSYINSNACGSFTNDGLVGCSVTKCTETSTDTAYCVSGTINSRPICFCENITKADRSSFYTDCCNKKIPNIINAYGITCGANNLFQLFSISSLLYLLIIPYITKVFFKA